MNNIIFYKCINHNDKIMKKVGEFFLQHHYEKYFNYKMISFERGDVAFCGIMVLNDDVVGVQFVHKHFTDNSKYLLDLLLIDKLYRNRGIGTKLIENNIKALKEDMAKIIAIYCEKNGITYNIIKKYFKEIPNKKYFDKYTCAVYDDCKYFELDLKKEC